MKISDIKEVIGELVKEELAIKEINYTSDSSGKSIVSQGAPGSIVRFVTENPELIKQMKDWVKDCHWEDIQDERDVDELSDEEILRGVQKYYEGGISAFIHGNNSKAEIPIGYKKEEGVGYVHSKDRAKDLKSIKTKGGDTEHWRIKFQSTDDLKKHGNTERSPINEIINMYDSLIKFVESLPKEEIDKITKISQEQDITAFDAVIQYLDSLAKNQNSVNEISSNSWMRKGQRVRVIFFNSMTGKNDSQSGIIKEPQQTQVIVRLDKNYKSVVLPWKFVTPLYDQVNDKSMESIKNESKHPINESRAVELNNMNTKQLKKLIVESINEVNHEFEEQQELLVLRRIQSYARWGLINYRKQPNEIKAIFDRIIKEIDGLVKTHKQGKEVSPSNTDKPDKSPLGVTQETITKTKNLLDQMISQRKKK